MTLVEFGDTARSGPVPYLVPHAGAGVSAVRALARALCERSSPVAVRLPGRETLLDTPPHTELPVLVQELAALIREHAAGRPIVLFGHSSGAITAFETARSLPADQLAALVVSAQQSPGRLPVPSSPVWTLPGEEFFARVAADGYLPDELAGEPEFRELVEPALRADYRVIDDYARCGAAPDPIPVPITAVRAADDPVVAADDVAAWAGLTTRGFGLRTLPGGHNLLRDAPGELAAVIREAALGTDRTAG